MELEEMCSIKIDKNGVSSKCAEPLLPNEMMENGEKILVVKAKPTIFSIQDEIPKPSRIAKGRIVNDLIRLMKQCYYDENNVQVCDQPIELLALVYEGCQACKEHLPILKMRVKKLRRNKIPTSLHTYDVKKKPFAADLFMKIGCKGTPCVGMRDPNNPDNYIHISSGKDGEIAFYSALSGIPNPLIMPITKKTVPLNLKRIK